MRVTAQRAVILMTVTLIPYLPLIVMFWSVTMMVTTHSVPIRFPERISNMATIKVRVNPNDPEKFAIYGPNQEVYNWWIPEDADWYLSTYVYDWQEFELEVPKPTRVFKAGDMYRGAASETIYVRGKTDKWVDRKTMTEMDSEIQHYPDVYKYIGNINDE